MKAFGVFLILICFYGQSSFAMEKKLSPKKPFSFFSEVQNFFCLCKNKEVKEAKKNCDKLDCGYKPFIYIPPDERGRRDPNCFDFIDCFIEKFKFDSFENLVRLVLNK